MKLRCGSKMKDVQTAAYISASYLLLGLISIPKDIYSSNTWQIRHAAEKPVLEILVQSLCL